MARPCRSLYFSAELAVVTLFLLDMLTAGQLCLEEVFVGPSLAESQWKELQNLQNIGQLLFFVFSKPHQCGAFSFFIIIFSLATACFNFHIEH